MPRFIEIKWQQAACDGMSLNNFFSFEEENKEVEQWVGIKSVRSTCAACPIWAECAAYGIEYEEYGIWGGLSSKERKAFRKSKSSTIRNKAIHELESLGISRNQIMEAIGGK